MIGDSIRQRSAAGWTRGLAFYILLAALCQSGCSVPKFEQPDCAAARDAVKRFYSFHFGSDMQPTYENAVARSAYLTNELLATLKASGETAVDHFTATDSYPKAFRVGSCTSDSSDKAQLQVLLLWKTDDESEQKEVLVEAVKVGDRWLINKVTG